MSYLDISQTKDYFIKDGKPFFYLADTAWTAFQRPNLDEWAYYLNYRRLQGFNAVQIKVLPRWDASQSESSYPAPFHHTPQGNLDFYAINPVYFDRAETMLEMAVKRGITPALVVLWADHVQDTWLSKKQPGQIIPLDAVGPYAEYIAQRFAKYHPLYLVSGDTNFESRRTLEAFAIALDTLKATSAACQTTLHLWGDSTYIPAPLLHNKNLDFYMYQSGHKRDKQHYAYQFATELYNSPIKRPIINGEPCYEGLSRTNPYVRYSTFDVRKATWQSLLSGAKAGITYGAEGCWSWHRRGDQNPGKDILNMKDPFDWRTALHFPGAADVSLARWLFETFNLFNVEPAQDLLIDEIPEIRAAASSNREQVVVYIPYSTDVHLGIDLSQHTTTLINLAGREFGKADLVVTADGVVVRQSEWNSDTLLLAI